MYGVVFGIPEKTHGITIVQLYEKSYETHKINESFKQFSPLNDLNLVQITIKSISDYAFTNILLVSRPKYGQRIRLLVKIYGF